jgi:hypothetical protein
MSKKRGNLIYMLPSGEDEFYALRWTGSRMFGHYQVTRHKNLEPIGTGTIKIYADGSIANFEGARVIGDQFVVFLSDKKDGYNHIFMQPYGKDLKPEGESVLLAKYKLEKGQGKGWFDIRMSNNKEFFAVVWQIPGKKDTRHRYGFKIFDTEMNEINDGDYPLPFDSKLSQIHSHYISDQGEYFLTVTEFQEDETKKLFKDNRSFKALHIYHIAEDGLQDFELDIEGKRVEAIAMTANGKDIFTITGIYGEKDETGVNGVFYQTANLKTHEVLDQGFKEFSKEFITQGWSEKAKKKAKRREERGKGDPKLYNYQMREAIIQDDGSIVGTLEQYYIQIQNYTDTRTGQVTNTYYYYYNDIIAYKIGVDGEFEWLEKVRKHQVSTNDGGPFSSYESFVSNNKLYFIFNDNVSNYNIDGSFADPDRLNAANYSRKRNVVAIAEIDLESGEQKRKTFFNRSDVTSLAVPKLFEVNYNTGELLIYTIYSRKEKIGLLKFDE